MMFGEGSSHWNPLEEEDVEKAIGAIKSHVSQLDQPESVDKWMRRWRSENGKNIDAPFAEGFKKFQLVPGFTPDDDDENQDDEETLRLEHHNARGEPAITNLMSSGSQTRIQR